MKNKNSKLILCFFATIVFGIISSLCLASEEDYAIVKMVEITAKTTCEIFGTVIVKTKQADDGIGLEYLQVTYGGKQFQVPPNELGRIKQIDLSTLKISSEIGYPDKNIGPHLYITIQSVNWENKYRVTFTEKGYKGISQ